MRQTRILSMLLALMVLLVLAGCGGGPSAAEGAEPSSAPNATAPDTTAPAQDTQSPEAPQETEPAPAAEVLLWIENTIQIVSSDTILAKSNDKGYAILNIDGTVRTWLPDFQSVIPVNPYCFTATSDGVSSLLDLNGNVIIEDVKEARIKCQTSDDPWGIIQYTAVERQDFGEKTKIYLMRTDTFENILEVDTDPINIQIYYDGAKYRMGKANPASGETSWSELDGTPVEPYHNPVAASRYIDESVLDCAPYIYQIDSKAPHNLYPGLAVDGKIEVKTPALLKYSEDAYSPNNANGLFGLMDFSGNKITDIKYKWCYSNDYGVLATTPDHKTDLYDMDGNFCISSDTEIGFSKYEFPPFGVLETNNANKKQTGIYDFAKKEFIFTTEEAVSGTKIVDKYALGDPDLNVTALYVYYKELQVLVCGNGSIIENVQPIHTTYSAFGQFPVQSTKNLDQIMVVNVDTGEIVSEFQAHLTK